MKKFTISNEKVLLENGQALKIDISGLNLGDIRVIDAKLTYTSIEDGAFLVVPKSKVSYELLDSFGQKLDGWDNIDYIETMQKNSSIDISDELQNAFDKKGKYVKLIFSASGVAQYFRENGVQIEYILLSEYQANSSSHEISLGKAGNASIDLATGQLCVAMPLVSSDSNVLPLSINATYNSIKNDKLSDIGLPEHWNLNINQFLIKNEDDEFLQFSYIDEKGKEQSLEEKYYYLNENDERVYKKRSELKVDINGNLMFEVNNTRKEILTELEAPSGLKLVSSIEGITGHEYVNYEPEELKNVKNSIENLNRQRKEFVNSLTASQEQLCTLTLNKIIAKDNAIQTYANSYGNYIPSNNGDGDDIIVGFSLADGIGDEAAVKAQNDAFNRIYKERQSRVEFPNKVSSLIDNKYLKNYDKTYQSETILDRFAAQFYKSSDERKDYFIQTMGLNPNSNDQHDFALYPVYNDTNFYNLDQQIELCKRQISLYMDSLDEIDKSLSVYEDQKRQYETQVPVHYLYSENNIVYGFGKTYEKKANIFGKLENIETNVYRLILIADAYDNMISISYEDMSSNKIKSITDSAENVITFDYENGLLKRIADARDRRVGFKFEGSLLTITHFDETNSYFHVKNDKLSYVINDNGLGAKFSFTDNKVSQVDSLSGLEKVENGVLTIKQNVDFTNISDLNALIIENKNVKFTYNNYMSTTITNSKNKSITYLFDKLGKVRTVYENDFVETDEQFYTHATQFDYQDNRKNEKVIELQYAENLLENKNFASSQPVTISGLYLGDIVCSDSTVPYSYDITTQTHKIEENSTNKKDSVCITGFSNASCHNTYILSGWAKADSAFVITDEDEAKIPQYLRERKFELRAEITYANLSEDETNPTVFKKSFDWRNTDWQYCAVPIKIDATKQIEKIECFVDYSNNTGSITFSALELKEGDFERIVYDDQNRPIEKTSGHSDYKVSYNYMRDSVNPCAEIITKESGEQFITKYEYTKQGKLLRSVDYDGIVNENVYNDKGQVVKSITYHKDEPSSKLYQEKILDEKGSETKNVNELGEEINSLKYIERTGIVESQIDKNGVETSFGYAKDDTLLEETITIDGIESTNTFGYNLDFLTSLKHNNFEIGYDYDNQGRTSKISIAGEEYLSKSYADNEEITTLKTGEVYRQIFNDDGKVLETYYTPAPSSEVPNPTEILLAQNIYNSYGDLIDIKDSVNNTEQKLYLNKFGDIEKITDIQHGQNVTIENQYADNHEDIECTVMSIAEEDFAYCYERAETPDARLQSITLPNDDEQKLGYDKLQRISEITTGNISKQYAYLKSGDHASNLVSKLEFGVAGLNKDNLRYSYDEKGNITEIRENNHLIARYKYDGLSRIIREDNKAFNKTTTFSYDAGGNISQRTEYLFTLTDNLDFETGTPITYSYPANGWRDQLQQYNGERFEYDALGNPTIYRDKSLTWSHGRQLDKFADIAEFKYNVSGIRTSKKANGFTTNFFLNGNKILRQQDASNTLTFYYGADGITGFHLSNSVVNEDFYYKKNAQNDIIGIYSTNGVQIAKYEYDAWGNCVAKYLQSDGTYAKIEKTYSYNDTTIINRFIAFKNPFRYRSYYYDFETSLYYLNSRYYDPEIGRFINADDISTLDVSQIAINGINLYAYCSNNPINNVDTSGFIPTSIQFNSTLISKLMQRMKNLSFANSIHRAHITTSNYMIGNSNISSFFGNVGISMTKSRQNKDNGIFYIFDDLGNNASLSYGVGIDLVGLVNLELSADLSNGLINASLQLFSFLHIGLAIGSNGVGINLGVNIKDTSYDLNLKIGKGTLALVAIAVCALPFVAPLAALFGWAF